MSPQHRKQVRTASAITLAGIAAAATTFAAVQKLVYTRQEGRAMERRIDHVEENYREDMREVRAGISSILSRLPKK